MTIFIVLGFFLDLIVLCVVVRFYIDHQRIEEGHAKNMGVIRAIMNRVIENQRTFVPVLDKVGDVAQDVWESRETRASVLASHERQESLLESINKKLEQL